MRENLFSLSSIDLNIGGKRICTGGIDSIAPCNRFYLDSEKTQTQLTSVAYVHPEYAAVSNFTQDFLRVNRIFDGAGFYQECREMGRTKLETYGGRGKAVDLSDAANPPSAGRNNPENLPTVTEVGPEDEYEGRIWSEIIPANATQVSFNDIGSLDAIKKLLWNLVILPLENPDMLKAGLKPCKGVLLFGPPGTGKTMLAEAIANEAKATFINVSMSTITSRLAGDAEKYVRALFTTAAKVAPTIIFVDEADSMFGKRTSDDGQHDPLRIMKNEFRSRWDGITSKHGEQILVLAATNRPFDLEDAIIRRFQRKIMVGMPSTESREEILTTILSEEKTENLNLPELATITKRYTGSDLANLYQAAALNRYLEHREREKQMKLAEEKAQENNNDSTDASAEAREDEKEAETAKPIILRPLNMEDFMEAMKQVSASVDSESNEMNQWNEMHGEGGSRKTKDLFYFL